jgi:hypothetical protein
MRSSNRSRGDLLVKFWNAALKGFRIPKDPRGANEILTRHGVGQATAFTSNDDVTFIDLRVE